MGNGYLLDQDLKFSKGAIVLVPLVIGKAVKRQRALQGLRALRGCDSALEENPRDCPRCESMV